MGSVIYRYHTNGFFRLTQPLIFLVRGLKNEIKMTYVLCNVFPAAFSAPVLILTAF